ncbi:hypothetical protein Q8F55_001865 [Vanrija albida]|uniref:glucan 1,3-beta-glucosidase n=1 Tax=Vanrija albida TaxID=181172 RepID=A0ABR3Q8F5_9TREE
MPRSPRTPPPVSAPLMSISSPYGADSLHAPHGHEEYELGPSPTHAYLADGTYNRDNNPFATPNHSNPGLMEKDHGEQGLPREGALRERYPNEYPSYDSDRNLFAASGGNGGSPASGLRNERYDEPRKSKRKWLWILLGLLAVLAIGLGVGLGVGLTRNKKSSSGGSSSGNNNGGGAPGPAASGSDNIPGVPNQVSPSAASGLDGSFVTSDRGVNFTYVNKFGGKWAQDPDNPYSVSGQAQSFTPSLLEEWKWGQDHIRGVNLGGWLVTEPFIVPALYEKYQNVTPNAFDEYTLAQAMGDNLAVEMEQHYATFITEQDFAEIAGAGLNWVRIPIGFWAVDTEFGEPFLKGVSWTYFLKAIDWARKYGLRIVMDFHALPGSQNGWNHSGKVGPINWMHGVMGIANAQRSLEYMRSMVQYISQPGIKEVVPVFGLVNEILSTTVGQDAMGTFYYHAYSMIRNMTGVGEGKGPILAVHDGFMGIKQWPAFLNGADRLAMDQHPYLAFDPPFTDTMSVNAQKACAWGGGTNDTQTEWGIVLGGEWSIAWNDCGKWLLGVNSPPIYPSSCAPYDQWMNYNQTFKDELKNLAMASMDSLQNWFFWTWKIGNSTELGYPSSPFWHYKLGLKEGWIPEDPRGAGGFCQAHGYCEGCSQFGGTYPASAVGKGPATPTIFAPQLSVFGHWPPTALGGIGQPSQSLSMNTNQIAMLPTLTQTGKPITLPTPTHAAKATIGNGWAYPQDTVGAYVTVAGCPYPDEYYAAAGTAGASTWTGIPIPTAVCTGA